MEGVMFSWWFFREDYYQEGNHVHARLKVLEAYKRALYTWARWVDKNVDANRTQVIFRGYSATHFRYLSYLYHITHFERNANLDCRGSSSSILCNWFIRSNVID